MSSSITQLPYHFSIILPPEKEWFSPKEVASLIGRTDQYIRNCFDNQRILGHTVHGRSAPGKEQRRSYQIHRDCVMLYLMETANYEPEDYLQRVCQVVSRLSYKHLQEVRLQLEKLLQSRKQTFSRFSEG